MSPISLRGYIAVRQFRQPATSSQCAQACVATLLQAGGWRQDANRINAELVKRMRPDERGGTNLEELAQHLRSSGVMAFGAPGAEFKDLVGMGIGCVVLGVDPGQLYGPPIGTGSHAIILASEPSSGPGEVAIWIGDPHPSAASNREFPLRHVQDCYEAHGRRSLFIAERRFSEMNLGAATLGLFLARANATIREDLARHSR